MVNQEIQFFDGVVIHKRAGTKHHEFVYKYMSLYLTMFTTLKSSKLDYQAVPFGLIDLFSHVKIK